MKNNLVRRIFMGIFFLTLPVNDRPCDSTFTCNMYSKRKNQLMLDYNLVTIRNISVVILAIKLGHSCANKKSLQKDKHSIICTYSILNRS